MFFLINQCVWRLILSGWQSTLYRYNKTAKSIFKRFAVFAFIQEDNAIEAYEALEEHIYLNGFEQKFRELLSFEDTFN
ncbi:hypothetical protein HZS_3771 [Henneguya salminicola]|nr:hypothetical protein HZS_3771 [Henneguya salminicola]